MSTITLPLPALAKSLAAGASIVEKSGIPILNNMRLHVAKGEASMVFTDSDVWLSGSIAAQSDMITGTTIPAQLFAKAAVSMEGEEISLDLNCSRVELRAGRAKLGLPILPVDGFPCPVSPDLPDDYATVEAETLKSAIDTVLYAAGDGILHVQGVHFDGLANNGKVDIATYDGKRLSLATAVNRGAPLDPFSIPLKSTKALSRICGAATGDVDFFLVDRLATFRGGGWSLTTKLADPRFPPYAKLTNIRSKTPINVKRQALHKALSRLALVSDRYAIGCKVDLATDLMTVTLAGSQIGNATEEIGIAYDGPDATYGYSLPLLRDAVRNCACDELEIHIDDERRAIIMAAGDESAVHFLAPFQI